MLVIILVCINQEQKKDEASWDSTSLEYNSWVDLKVFGVGKILVNYINPTNSLEL